MLIEKNYTVFHEDIAKIFSNLGLTDARISRLKITLDATSTTMSVEAELLDDGEDGLLKALAACAPKEVSAARYIDDRGREYVQVDGERWYST